MGRANKAILMSTIQKTLPKSAQSVQDVLTLKGIDTQVIEYPASTRTAEDAANAIGCQVAQIIKSLIFKGQNSQKPILLLVSGINRLDEKALVQKLGETLQKADADFVRSVTGFAIGGIPPVGHLQLIQTYIDEDLLKHEILWAAAGTPNTVFRIFSRDLESLTQGQVMTLRKG